MKKILIAVLAIFAISGCDQIQQSVEDVKQSVKDTAVETIKETASEFSENIKSELEAAGISTENIEKTNALVADLHKTIQDAKNMDFENIELVTQTQEHLSSSFACLKSISPEFSTRIITDIIASIANDANMEELLKNSITDSKSTECKMP